MSVGRFIDFGSAARRPPASVELAAYGLRGLVRGAAVLDIGCGDGRIALGAAVAGASSVVGVDPDADAIRAARRAARAQGLGGVTFRVGAAQHLPVPSERFDLAVLSWSL